MTTPYATVDEANAYFAERLRTDAWDDASAEDQEKALKMATRAIERLNFAGEKADENQEMQFPRGEDTEVPQDVKDACCEEALALLSVVTTSTQSPADAARIKRKKIGDAEEEYDTSLVSDATMNGMLSYEAWVLLTPYFRDPRNLDLDR